MLFDMNKPIPLLEFFKFSDPHMVIGGGILGFCAIYRGKNKRSAMFGDGNILIYPQSIRAMDPDLLRFEMLKNRFFLEWRRRNVSQNR